jgi:hypothetical protein
MVCADSQSQSLSLASDQWGRDILCQLCTHARELDALPEDVVWSLLHGSGTD